MGSARPVWTVWVLGSQNDRPDNMDRATVRIKTAKALAAEISESRSGGIKPIRLETKTDHTRVIRVASDPSLQNL